MNYIENYALTIRMILYSSCQGMLRYINYLEHDFRLYDITAHPD